MGIGFFDRDWSNGAIHWTAPMRKIYGFSPDVPITPELVGSRLECDDS